MEKKENVVLDVVKANGKAYINLQPLVGSYSIEYIEHIDRLLFDGIKSEKTYMPPWVVLPSVPSKVEVLTRQPNINHRYELADVSLKSDRIPLIIEKGKTLEGETMAEWFCQISSLYIEKSDPQPDKLVPVSAEFNILMEIEKISFADTTSPIFPSIKNAENQLIDKIMFPPITLPEKPCRLSSKESYNIIREYVKRNINSDVAKITSDYDFCFSVGKKIILLDKEGYTVDVNASFFGRKKRPKYETRYRKERISPIFEMTYSPENYKGYTPIQGFTGNNHKDLQENIEKYLKKLMEDINRPLKDCPHCNGMGVIIDKKTKTPQPDVSQDNPSVRMGGMNR
ncbi:MAG: hypothetical protein DDT22_00332 [candidate division WS2 bacterium]|nr:hypothetical protein [Candidatus Lithacetigena glycinireducens]